MNVSKDPRHSANPYAQQFYVYPTEERLIRKRRRYLFNLTTWIVIFFLILREVDPFMHEKLIVIYFIIDRILIPVVKGIVSIIFFGLKAVFASPT